MKKKSLVFFFLLPLFNLMGQKEVEKTHLSSHSVNNQTSESANNKISPEAASGWNVVWSEDFSNGIPATWTNSGQSGTPLLSNSNAIWEYRGSSTNPTLSTGSRGGYSSQFSPIMSSSASNGFIIFDSDYLDNNGNIGAFGTGLAPAPHIGGLSTGIIDLSGKTDVRLVMQSYFRAFAGRCLVVFSADGGSTWTDTTRLFQNLFPNDSTGFNERTQIDVSSILGGSSQAKIKFVFDGTYNDPGLANLGYYFWMLDDLVIEERPLRNLVIVEDDCTPGKFINFEGGGRTGNMLVNQTVPINFSANILSDGTETQTNVTLHVDIYKNGVFSSTVSSFPIPSMQQDDTLNGIIVTSNFTPNGVGRYDCFFRISSDNITSNPSTLDTTFSFWVNPINSSGRGHGLDFGSKDNAIGTNELGNDGSALATRLVFPNSTDTINGTPFFALTHLDIDFAPSTVNGGDIVLECYREDQIDDFGTGFITTPIFSKRFTLNRHSGKLSRFDIRSCGSQPVYLYPDSIYYFVARLFSKGGTFPVEIHNDQTVVQPSQTSLMFSSDSWQWFTGFAACTRFFESPHIRVLSLPGSDPINGIDVQDECEDSFTWINGVTYVSDNNSAKDTLLTVGGCDSIVLLDLNFRALDTGVTVSGPTITANADSVQYQWYVCDSTGLQLMKDQTSRSFTATWPGFTYALITTNGYCSDTTDCIAANGIGIEEEKILSRVNIYPNPSNGLINIDMPFRLDVLLKITDMYGRTVYESTFSEAKSLRVESSLSSGTYILTLELEGERKFYPLVIQN